MPRWLALTTAEARRARVLAGVARRQPLLPIAMLASAGAMGWLEVRGAIATARAVNSVPQALLPVNATLLWFAVLVGLGSAFMAPRASQFDEQFRLLPLRKVEAFAGTTAVPLALVWIASLVPLAGFVLPFFLHLSLDAAAVWSALFVAAYGASCVVGAALAESIRLIWLERVSRRALNAMATVSIVAWTLGGGVVRGSWWAGFAVWLPARATHGEFDVASIAFAAVALGASLAAGTVAWLIVGATTTRALHRTAARGRFPARWNGAYALLAWWMVSAVIRDTRLWASAAFALAGAGALVAVDVATQHGAHPFAPLAVLLALAGGAQVAISLSERLQASSWFWRLAPAPRRAPGLWWWGGASALAAAISVPALILPSVVGAMGTPTTAVTLVASCFAAATIGRAMPWNSRSQGQQALATALYFGALIGASSAFDWAATRSTAPIAVVAVVGSLCAISLALCARLPWRSSWLAS